MGGFEDDNLGVTFSSYSIHLLTNMKVDLIVCFVAVKRSKVRVTKRARMLSRRTGGVQVHLGRIGLGVNLKVESRNPHDRGMRPVRTGRGRGLNSEWPDGRWDTWQWGRERVELGEPGLRHISLPLVGVATGVLW